MSRYFGFSVILRALLISAIHLPTDKSSKETHGMTWVEFRQLYLTISAPLITPLQEELILETGSNVTVHCAFSEELQWVKWNSQTKSWLATENHILNSDNPFRSHETLLHLEDVRARDVGRYYCVNKRSFILGDFSKEEDIHELVNNWNAVGIYIFVKDRKQFLITGKWYYEQQFEQWIIPCKPADPSTVILLTQDLKNASIVIANSTAILAGEWKTQTIDGKLFYNEITFDPRQGFTLQSSEPMHDVTCTGSNYASYQSERVDPVVYDTPKVTIFSDKGHHAIVGGSFNLTCEVTMPWDFPVDLKWIFPNGSVGIQYDISPQTTYRRSEYMNVTTNILTIKNAEISHSGIYKCKANNINGKAYYGIDSYPMKIFTPPDRHLTIWNHQIYTVSGVVNRSIFLVGKVDSFPQTTITWERKEKGKIKASEKYRFEQKGAIRTLEIRHAQSMDSGSYMMKSSNGYKTSFLGYAVLVFDVPKVEMTDIYVRVNCEARLICRVFSNIPAEASLTFTKCSTMPHWPFCLNTTETVAVERFGWTNSTFEYLYVYNYSPTGPTKVRCEVHNWITPFRKPEFADAHIFVSDFEPKSNMTVFRSDGPQELIKGDVLLVVCSAMVYHLKVTDLQWYRNGSLVERGLGVSITTSSSRYSFNTTLELVVSQVGDVTLECRAPYLDNPNRTMRVNLTETIYEPVPPYINYTNINSPTTKHNISDTLKLQCKGHGVPKPSVAWLKDDMELHASDKIKFDDDNSTLTIPVLGSQDAGTYKCRIYSRLGDVEAFTEVQVYNNAQVPPIWIFVFIGVCFGFSVLVFFLVYRMHRDRAKIRVLRAAGLANFAEGAVELINPDLPVDEQVELLPYDRRYEFPREKLQLGKQLGCGAFGVVFQASAQGITELEPTTVVAVKMLHQTADNEMLRALVSELKILVHLGRHLNVVNLLGAVTKNLETRELMVIVEYCPLGCLKDYLVANREQFVDQIYPETGKIDGTIRPQRKFANHGYENVASSMHPSPTTTDLVCWGFQVARGMEYLASRKVLHGDLALRNILLCENNVVKICDFGLARSLYKRSAYKKQSDAPLPVRWLALETFSDHVFSTYTDIWSFGVVLWELFSLGKVPYPEIGYKDLYPMLRDGYRMEKPQFASEVLYEIMLECWSEEPGGRPLFHELERKLAKIFGNAEAMTYIAMNEPFSCINRNNSESRQMDYLSTMAPPCGASRPKHHYVNEPILCEEDSTSEEADPNIPSRAPRGPKEDHHNENMPMERRDMRSIENPSYGVFKLETSV